MVLGIPGGEYMDLRVIHDEFSILDVNILSKCNKNVPVVMILWFIQQEVCMQTPVIVKVDIFSGMSEVAIFLSLDNSIVVHEMLAQRQLRVMKLTVISETIATEYSRVGNQLEPNHTAKDVIWTVGESFAISKET
jgi:hypothetical protein